MCPMFSNVLASAKDRPFGNRSFVWLPSIIYKIFLTILRLFFKLIFSFWKCVDMTGLGLELASLWFSMEDS